MIKEISQRELRNESGAILRAVEAGDMFIVMRNGTPVAELRPIRRRAVVPREDVLQAFQSLPPVDYRRFRDDLDAGIDQDLLPNNRR